jgi:hypothetical protein
MASGQTFAAPRPSTSSEASEPATSEVIQVISVMTARTAATTIPATTSVPATSVVRATGAASSVSRYRCSSAEEIARVTIRIARNDTASGTIRLIISASMYCSTVVISRMLKASLSPSG